MTITFSSNIISIFIPSCAEYAFVMYQGSRWYYTDAPDVSGINYTYNDPIMNHETHLVLHASSGRRNINFRVSTKILRLNLSGQWIPVLVLLRGSRIAPRTTRIKEHNLRELPTPINLDLGVWREPRAPPPPPAPLAPLAPLAPVQGQVAQYSQSVSEQVDRLLNTTLNAAVKNKIIEHEKSKKIPSRIARLIAQDAEVAGEVCPITMDTITATNCSVTSCFHVFDRDAIAQWMVNNTACPVCKQACSVAIVCE